MPQSSMDEARSSPPPVPELLVLVASGDREAFSMLYDAYASRLFGLTLRVLGDRAQTEEVTEEVFLEVWRTANLYDPARDAQLGWMLAIAHRLAVARIRSPKGPSHATSTHERMTEFGIDGPATRAVPSPQAARVWTSLDVLTPVQRRALELAYFGGHTHTEVAQILQIAPGSAKIRIRNALLHLRESLGSVPA